MDVIDNFDGALYPSTNTKDSGIVSYSTLLFYPDYFVMDVSSTISTCILTWMNSLTVESRETSFPLLILIYWATAITIKIIYKRGMYFFTISNAQ